MTKKPNGGPAFPQPRPDYSQAYGGANMPFGGMSLRDWFAGQALVGFMASSDSKERPTLSLEYFARCAYETADAMLEARNK